MTLSQDQRWLLLHMGTWQIVHALCSKEGVTRLMQSCWGSAPGRRADSEPGAPAWLKKCGWETQGSVIKARAQGGPQVTIKAAEINRFIKAIPDEIRLELVACRDAGTANAVLRGRFCHCGNHETSYPWQKDRICPPTRKQEREADEEYWRIIDWQNSILSKALGVGGESWVEGDQLELFGAVS